MSTKTADPQVDQGKPDPGQGDQGTKAKPDSSPPTMADVRKEIREEIEAALEPIKKLLGGGGKPAEAGAAGSGAAPQPAAPDLGQMVDDALNKVLGDRDQAAKDKAHADQHAQLAAAAERKPIDRPRRSRWLGNIWDND